MRDSYNDFCYRQRENFEASDRRDGRWCVRSRWVRRVTRAKRQSNQSDAIHAGISRDARRAGERSRAPTPSRRARYRYAQNFVGSS